MKRLLAILTVSALPLSANAQALGNQAGCERVAGLEESTDNLFVLWPDRIERWESFCKIESVEGDVNVRSIITTQCSGEGDTWKQVYGMTPLGENAFSIWPVESPEMIFELRSCE